MPPPGHLAQCITGKQETALGSEIRCRRALNAAKHTAGLSYFLLAREEDVSTSLSNVLDTSVSGALCTFVVNSQTFENISSQPTEVCLPGTKLFHFLGVRW